MPATGSRPLRYEIRLTQLHNGALKDPNTFPHYGTTSSPKHNTCTQYNPRMYDITKRTAQVHVLMLSIESTTPSHSTCNEIQSKTTNIL